MGGDASTMRETRLVPPSVFWQSLCRSGYGNGGEPRDLHRTGGGAGACPVGIVTPKVGKYVAEKEKVIVPTGEANEPRSNGE
jgi:hypothetical protein